MKKTILLGLTVAFSLSLGIALAGFIGAGYGQKVSATTTAALVELETDAYVYELSFKNAGTVDVQAAVNCSLATFTGMVAAATSVQIPAGAVYTFNGNKGDDKRIKLESFCYAATSGTQTVYVAGY